MRFAWQRSRAPFLPKDFDERYFQAAPEDQQIEYPNGGKEIELLNLTPVDRVSFSLPTLDVPVEFALRSRTWQEMRPVVDTIVIEPDQGRFSVTLRTSLPLKRNIFEVSEILVGRMSPGWYRSRATGKRYHGTLRGVAKSREFAP